MKAIKTVKPTKTKKSPVKPIKAVRAVRATENQKQVFKKVFKKIGKGRKVSVSKEMQGVYSKSMARNPQRLIRTKGWQALLKKYLPDERLTEKLNEHIESTDSRVSLQAIDMGLKLKNKYPANKIKLGVYKDMMDEITE